MSNISALIMAAGKGSRLGLETPKQYLLLDDKTIIEHTINKFKMHPAITHICVVIAEEDASIFNKIFNNKIDYCYGGKKRNHSVKLGLEHLQKSNPDYVLIHDAARPFIEKNVINQIINNLSESEGVIAANKIVDTIKLTHGRYIKDTIPREQLFAAQTPQAFKFDTILKLHQKYQDHLVTDDSMFFELANLKVKIIESPKNNFKITTKEDLILAKAIIKKHE